MILISHSVEPHSHSCNLTHNKMKGEDKQHFFRKQLRICLKSPFHSRSKASGVDAILQKIPLSLLFLFLYLVTQWSSVLKLQTFFYCEEGRFTKRHTAPDQSFAAATVSLGETKFPVNKYVTKVSCGGRPEYKTISGPTG